MRTRAAAVVRRHFDRLHQQCIDWGAIAVVYRFAPEFRSFMSVETPIITRGLKPEWAHFLEEEPDKVRAILPDRVFGLGHIIHFKDPYRQSLYYDALEFLHLFEQLQGGDAVSLPLFGGSGNDGFCTAFYDHDLSPDELSTMPALQNRLQAIHVEIAIDLQMLVGQSIVLSPRELEVLRQMARGQSNRQIAESVGVTPATVDTYARRLFHKLDAHDRMDAILKAVSLGILRL